MNKKNGFVILIALFVLVFLPILLYSSAKERMQEKSNAAFRETAIIPFMVGANKETFWFPLAAGTIGGLIMSVVGVFLFLPIFTLKRHDK